MTPTAPLPRLAGENVASLVREHLAEARAAGVPFDSAWPEALAPLRLHEQRRNRVERRERNEWREAFRSTRTAWEAAYRGAPAAEPELAAERIRTWAQIVSTTISASTTSHVSLRRAQQTNRIRLREGVEPPTPRPLAAPSGSASA